LKNREIAELLYDVADVLEYQQVEWKPRAYRKAAQMIENLGEDIKLIYERKGREGLTEIPGVGKSIADHIAEYLETGKVEKFKILKGKAPSGTVELLEIRGLGQARSGWLETKPMLPFNSKSGVCFGSHSKFSQIFNYVLIFL
jgi:DNA polymerase (family X)